MGDIFLSIIEESCFLDDGSDSLDFTVWPGRQWTYFSPKILVGLKYDQEINLQRFLNNTESP